jgi:hypothetical protein
VPQQQLLLLLPLLLLLSLPAVAALTLLRLASMQQTLQASSVVMAFQGFQGPLMV